MSKQISGVDDRTERNRQTMSGALERLAAALETSAVGRARPPGE